MATSRDEQEQRGDRLTRSAPSSTASATRTVQHDRLDGERHQQQPARERARRATHARRAARRASPGAPPHAAARGHHCAFNCSRSTLDHREAAGQRAVRHRVHPCGAGAGPVYRRHYHPDLSDLDLRAGRASGVHKGYEYGRTQNPTRAALEGNIAAMESGKAAFAFASGLAATRAVMTLLQSGDHVVVTDNTYGGTYRLFERVLRKGGLDFTYVDTSDLDATAARLQAQHEDAVRGDADQPGAAHHRPRRRVGSCAHDRGAAVVVDNTFASPYAQRPIEFGADLVLHSTTKFLNGHSDSVGGVVVSVRDDHTEWLKFVQNAEGAILGPMDAWLVLRGTKTLPIRMERHNANAERIAAYPGRRTPR